MSKTYREDRVQARMPLKRVAGKIVRIIYDGWKTSRVYLAFILEIIGKTPTTEKRKGKQETDTFLRAILRWKRFYSEPDELVSSRSPESRIRETIEERDVEPREPMRTRELRVAKSSHGCQDQTESEKSITSATLVGKAQSHWLSSRGPRYARTAPARSERATRRGTERSHVS